MKRALLFLLLAAPLSAQTETFYVCEGGDGTLPETATCATAYDAADFNTAGNWDTDDADDGQIGPNDTVLLMDDGGKFLTQFTVQESGTSGKPITIGAQSGDSPILSGADVISTWAAGAANVWNTALTTEPNIVYFDGVLGYFRNLRCLR